MLSMITSRHVVFSRLHLLRDDAAVYFTLLISVFSTDIYAAINSIAPTKILPRKYIDCQQIAFAVFDIASFFPQPVPFVKISIAPT